MTMIRHLTVAVILLFTIPLLAADYQPKSSDEIAAIAAVVRSEIAANKWSKGDEICLMIANEYPSKQLLRQLGRMKLHVKSEKSQHITFSCDFSVSLQPVDVSLENARITFESADFREINSGEGDLALLVRAGEYSLKKVDGQWKITDYVPDKRMTPSENKISEPTVPCPVN